MERPARRPAPPLVRRSEAPASLDPSVAFSGSRPRPHVPMMVASGAPSPGRPPVAAFRSPIPMANLRRNVCPHFYMTGNRGALPVHAPHLMKALARQDSTISRCQLRGGVHLEQGYVADVCLASRFNQCVFYEDDLTRGD